MLSKKAEQRRKQLIWKTAMTDASHQDGNLRVQWERLEVIDPVIYNFKKDIGFELRSLRLVGVQLENIPDDFGGAMQGLKVLSLSNNNLVYIPDSLVQLSSLTELNLVYNKITRLPPRLGLMCSLTTLLISNNHLTRLPITFGALNLLQLVDIGCNHLTILPENLDHMTSCKSLILNNNKLIRLPRCLAKMPSLTHLSASNNELTYIPFELTSSRTITTLRLNTNKITYVPERIGDMTQLKELCLDYNLITRLPVSFWRLQSLTMLRVEGNAGLVDPPPEVVLLGAKAVVAHCGGKYNYDKMGRMRTIIQHMQSALAQAHEYMLVDPALFEAGVIIDPVQKDPWYALQISHFWNDLLPKLKVIWRQMLNRGFTSSSVYEITDFPYSEKEMMWALANFSDAYGPVFRQQEAMFTRCACEDPFTGKRKPCVPPKIGYMCSRMSTLIKMHAVRQRDKEDRAWQAYKASGIRDAEMRAEAEAKQYLESGPGRHWLTDTAYAQAEEILDEGKALHRVQLRQEKAAKRKKEIVEKYAKRKEKLEKARDRKVGGMQEELKQLKEDKRKAPEGYMKNAIEERIDAVTRQIATVPEMIAIQALVSECEFECTKVNEDAFESDSLNSSELGSSDFSSDDDTEAARRWRFRLQRYRERERDKALKRWAKKEAHDLNRAQLEDKREHLADEGELGAAIVTDLKLRAMTFLDRGVKAGMIEPTVDAVTKKAKKMHKKVRRNAKHVADVAAMRVNRILSQFDGTIEEVAQELKYELQHQYVTYHTNMAKEKATREFNVIDSVREGRLGLGRDKAFIAWKKWVWTKRTRERRDTRKRWKMATKGFDAGMASVNSAQQQVDQWIALVDIYTDTPFWRHEVTGDVTYDRPSIRHYLPPLFEIPDPPEDLPAHITIDSSSDDGSSEDDWLRKGEALRKRRAAERRQVEQLRQDNYVNEDEDSEYEDDDETSTAADELGGGGGGGGGSIATAGTADIDNGKKFAAKAVLSSNGSGSSSVAQSISFYEEKPEPQYTGGSGGGGSLPPLLPRQQQQESELPQPPQHQRDLAQSLHKSMRPPTDSVSLALAAGGAEDDTMTVGSYSVAGQQSISEESRFIEKAVNKAREYMAQSQAYILRASRLKLPEVSKTNIHQHEIAEEMKQRGDDEYEIAFKAIRKKRNKLSTVRHNTYMTQANRKNNKSFAQIQEEERAKAAEDALVIPDDIQRMALASRGGTAAAASAAEVGAGGEIDFQEQYRTDKYGARIRSGAANVHSKVMEERLLALSGGDFDMVGTGKIGMELRTVLAQRALHVKKRLQEIAVNKGQAPRKKNQFFKTEILPFFKENYVASSSEEDSEEEQYQKKLERRVKRAKMKAQREKDKNERDEVVERFRQKRMEMATREEL